MALEHPRSAGRAAALTGRSRECAVLDLLVRTVRAGESQVLVLRGEAGVGKTALLDYLSGRAAGCQVARVVGVQSEMELAFAGLQRLCAPMLDQLDALPGPQRDALRTAFGIHPGAPPDPFLICLAVLGLLSEAGGRRPLVCLIDDQQWLDAATAQVLGFVGRRLAADPVALVFAARVPGADLAGLPELSVEGLAEEDSRALLDHALTGPLDERVKDVILAEARGNPLALMEFPRGLTPEELGGGFGLPEAVPLVGRIEESFRRQLDALPALSQRLLRLAAADPSGDPLLVWRAAAQLGVPASAVEPAVQARLVQFGTRVVFRHPLLRSAAYLSAPLGERRGLHAALAAVTDPVSDPDRRAWHRAQATVGPDEDVAAELEGSARRAQARGGASAAAAFLERASQLTPDPVGRVSRAIAAAEAKAKAGARAAAGELLAVAEAGPLDELGRARLSLVRGQMAFAIGTTDALPLLFEAAGRFEAVDIELAKETYLDALAAGIYLGSPPDRVGLRDVARAARAALTTADGGRVPDLLLAGLATLLTDGWTAGMPGAQRAMRAFRDARPTVEEEVRWLMVASRLAHDLWDDEAWRDLSERLLQLTRTLGVLSLLPIALVHEIRVRMHMGEFGVTIALAEEYETIREAMRLSLPPFGRLLVATWRGHGSDAFPLIEDAVSELTAKRQTLGLRMTYHVASVLYNGLGRYADAATAAESAIAYPEDLGYPLEALPELVEAAVRNGQSARAAAALEGLAAATRASGTGWGLGVEARCRALVSEGDEAERLYQESIRHLSASPARSHLARAHLLYGEWLRRERRRAQARGQLQIAHQMLEAMGMEAFAERAKRELLATSARPNSGTAWFARSRGTAGDPLTAQEMQVARLARDGLSNPEIAGRLFISARTVQYHLSKVFAKLGITSRGELHRAMPADPDPTAPAPSGA